MPESAADILRIEGVSRHFGGVKALVDITTSVKKGTIHSIIGPNGSGKTTLINVVTGFYRPDAGSITYKGRSIGGLPSDLIARLGIGRTFQNLRLFPSMTVAENLKSALHSELSESLFEALLHLKAVRNNQKAAQERAEAIARKLGIGEYLESPAASLAYGVRRLVEIGRALCLHPES